MSAQNLVREIVLHNFANPNPPKGAQPAAALLRDSAGNLYGTTTAGGLYNAGVVFKVDTSGVLTVLHTFTGGPDGSKPESGVIADQAGNLYGTTFAGGLDGCGVVYRLNASGETVLHYFNCRSDGANPVGGVIADGAGNLYGTASNGGVYDGGVVYKLSASGETVLHNFRGRSFDGSYPQSGVIRDAAGNLYGTTQSGGNGTTLFDGQGVVYKLDPSGNETILYIFTGGADGGRPVAGVVRDPAGNLYGAAPDGGNASVPSGVVYKLTPGGQETILHVFTGGSDGGSPMSGVIGDPDGNLYGTTRLGGEEDLGVVYTISRAGVETTLYSFSGAFQGTNASGGSNPMAGVIRDAEGNLYGTAWSGGYGSGVVFRVDSSGNETALAGFPGPTDGVSPMGNLARDAAGNIYGATSGGGKFLDGIVFKLDAAGRETVLHTFTGGSDGAQPEGGVTLDPAGNLYGTASRGGLPGGVNGGGVVWKIDPLGTWTMLYSFTGLADGANPKAAPILDAAGNLYGTTTASGFSLSGTIYKLDPEGVLTTLYTFTGGADGYNPLAGVIRDSSGNLYGTTTNGGLFAGTVYELDSSGRETVLYSFTDGADGDYPEAALLRDPLGNLYGTTAGPGDGGVVFKVDPSGHETVLYTFAGYVKGFNPKSGLTPDFAGNLYGTTFQGGTQAAGVAYRLNAAGEATLYTFSGGPDGGNPNGRLIFDAAGNLYGTTAAGGLGNGGVVFNLVR